MLSSDWLNTDLTLCDVLSVESDDRLVAHLKRINSQMKHDQKQTMSCNSSAMLGQ